MNLESKQTRYRPNTFVLTILIPCLVLLWSCGGGGGSSSDDSSSSSGALTFRIVYHHPEDHLQREAAVIDCAGEGVATIEAVVYDEENGFLQNGGPWDCVAGQGTITSVPAGSSRTIVILGKDSNGDIVFRGHKSGVDVEADRDNDAGTIDCIAFVPSLRAPADGSVVNGDVIGLAWDAVAGAADYRVKVSENSDLTDCIIDATATAENFGPEGLSNSQTYYWQVAATDSYHNTGIGSPIWSFTVDASHPNTVPVASITSPAQDSVFTTDDTITFSGNGSDAEDGDLSGASLVWRSNLDGLIGTGETCTSDTLSAGIHQITLTATDSEGATGTQSVTIAVNDLGPHGIMFLDSLGDVGMHSSLGVEDGRIFIAYYDETNSNLKVARSLNDGYDWSFTSIVSGSDAGRGSSVALDGENVFISTTMTNRIGIAVSSNSGDTWNTLPILPDNPVTSNASYDEYATSIDVDGQNIYISFLSYNVCLMQILKSPYSANAWEIIQISAPPDDMENGYYSSIHEHQGMLYISHASYLHDNIYLTRLSNTLSEPVTRLVDQIGAVNGGRGYTTSAVRQVGSATTVYIAYYDQSDGNLDLKFARSVNNGDNFSLSTIDASSDIIGKYPSMAITGNTILVAYYDESNGNLKLARSFDQGMGWDIQIVDDATDNVGRFASLAADGQKVYISYYDETNRDLKFAKSVDGGATWR